MDKLLAPIVIMSEIVFLEKFILENPIKRLIFLHNQILMCHSMLRLDATTKKRWLTLLFKFKKFSIKQAIFINEILSFQVEVHKQKKMKFYSLFF